eukprot:scaffold16319_cov77-Phaeocystis_antarctica.AAC.4
MSMLCCTRAQCRISPRKIGAGRIGLRTSGRPGPGQPAFRPHRRGALAPWGTMGEPSPSVAETPRARRASPRASPVPR